MNDPRFISHVAVAWNSEERKKKEEKTQLKNILVRIDRNTAAAISRRVKCVSIVDKKGVITLGRINVAKGQFANSFPPATRSASTSIDRCDLSKHYPVIILSDYVVGRLFARTLPMEKHSAPLINDRNVVNNKKNYIGHGNVPISRGRSTELISVRNHYWRTPHWLQFA